MQQYFSDAEKGPDTSLEKPVMIFLENINFNEFQELSRLQTNEKLTSLVTDPISELAPHYTLIDDATKVEQFGALDEREFQARVMADMKYKVYYMSNTLKYSKDSMQGFLFKAQQTKTFDN